MKLVMTLMVRDEADIVEAMVDHHLAQGIDLLIVTDNGSVDGTTEILQRYADAGVIDLRHNPHHNKRQGEAVTRMARDAATVHGADWVINADTDEFWVPVDRSLTLKEAFENIPTQLGSFVVPVIDMTGVPAASGTGFERLIYRDQRSVEDLLAIGLHAHATPDSVHVGDPNVEVSQGNHFVNIESQGEPDPAFAIEVLHFPWRSFDQFYRKVDNSGRAYAESGLVPSPNHHGMRDYRRLLDGTLVSFYIARHPSLEQIEKGLADGTLTVDRTIADLSLPSVPDVALPEGSIDVGRAAAISLVQKLGRIAELESELSETRAAAAADTARLTEDLDTLLRTGAQKITGLEDQLRLSEDHVRSLEDQNRQLHGRRVVRAADWVGRAARNARGTIRRR